jgi:hypothetical protein
MLNRLFATALLVAVMTMLMLPASVSSAPPVPPGDSPYGCFMGNAYYPHGALYHWHWYLNGRPLPHYDIYRCVNGTWVYVGSSDDMN